MQSLSSVGIYSIIIVFHIYCKQRQLDLGLYQELITGFLSEYGQTEFATVDLVFMNNFIFTENSLDRVRQPKNTKNGSRIGGK